MYALIYPYLQVDGTSVGFMSLVRDVNVDMLNECFELGPFHGLRKPHPDDETEAPKTPSPTPPPASVQSMSVDLYTVYISPLI